ncbi:MAG: cytochrome ubiquinol oxidase subunit I, partial [Pseudomonadota bacterium]|nr:cytochrome ubiquinol oxidase subunit I [Pseudomonadota bacterium]
EASTRWTPPTVMLLAAALLAFGFGTDWWSWHASGLSPDQSGQGATVYMFLALEGQLLAVAVLMALYLAARTSRGLVTRPRNNTFDLTTLFLVYTGGQGIVAALLSRLFPGAI